MPAVAPEQAPKGPFDDLPPLSADGLKAFYPESVAVRDAITGISSDFTVVSRTTHTLLNALPATSAAATLIRLPETGESLHIISRGLWPAWDLIPQTLRLAAPATIKTLHIATLSFSKANGEQLAALVDVGAVGSVLMICSSYLSSTEKDLVCGLATALQERGQRLVSRRCHAKVIAMELSDGRCLTIESSANLRSSRNIEQFTITHDRAVLDFHRTWMESAAAGGSQK
jgi:hypothetical protein